MRFAESLATATVAGIVVAVLVLMVQLVSSAPATYSADGGLQRDFNLAVPGLSGAVAAAGALVLQWSRPRRRRRKRRTKPAH